MLIISALSGPVCSTALLYLFSSLYSILRVKTSVSGLVMRLYKSYYLVLVPLWPLCPVVNTFIMYQQYLQVFLMHCEIKLTVTMMPKMHFIQENHYFWTGSSLFLSLHDSFQPHAMVWVVTVVNIDHMTAIKSDRRKPFTPLHSTSTSIF